MGDLGFDLETYLMNFAAFLPKLVTALVVFILGLVVAGFVSRAIRRTMKKRHTDPELTILAGKLSRWTVIIFSTALALEQINFDLTAFLTGLGIVGFTIGFAIQDVSKNFVAGMLLLLQQPFDIGDVIEVAGFAGKVTAVDLRDTEMRTLDGRYVSIPNGDVFTSAIVNFTRAESRRIALEAGVSYESDLEEVRRTAVRALEGVVGLLNDPAPRVIFHTFGGTTVDFTAYYWVDIAETDPLDAQDQGIELIKRAFEAAAIEMPFQTLTVINKNPG